MHQGRPSAPTNRMGFGSLKLWYFWGEFSCFELTGKILSMYFLVKLKQIWKDDSKDDSNRIISVNSDRPLWSETGRKSWSARGDQDT